jgi:2-methylcitrate dehydratase PrpD
MSTMSPDQWKQWAAADAERRGLHALEPLLEGLAAATARLRATEWQAAADRLSRPVDADNGARGER